MNNYDTDLTRIGSKRWEYLMIRRKRCLPVIPFEDFKELGKNGWEMCGIVRYWGIIFCNVIFYFKRPYDSK